jgi:hypothetical protein
MGREEAAAQAKEAAKAKEAAAAAKKTVRHIFLMSARTQAHVR